MQSLEFWLDVQREFLENYNENDSAWRGAIKSFLSNPDVFRHPHRKIVCLEENGMVTSRTIMFDLKIETFFKL